jgi:hypothetical protein
MPTFFSTNSNVCTLRNENLTITLTPTEATALQCILDYEIVSPLFRNELERILSELIKTK